MEMDDSSKQICRLCLEITPSCESEHIDENKKDIILEVLLINVNFEISDYAVVCKRCVEKLRDCLDFKSHCIKTLMGVDFKLGIKKEVLQSRLFSHKSTGHESSQVCRFCLSLIRDESFDHTAVWKDGVPLKDMIRNCLPQMKMVTDTDEYVKVCAHIHISFKDLNTVHEPVICKPCLSSMKKYYEFMKICEEVEQRIEHFRQMAAHDTADRVPLEDVLKFKDYNMLGKSLIIKKECLDVDNEAECLKAEEAVRIKCEEINIKDELQFSGMETNDLDHSELNENFGKDEFSKTEWRAKKIAKRGNRYVCPKCPYSSERRYFTKTHMRTHSDNESHKCFLCPFITNTKFSLKVHMVSHRGATKAYGCTECPYETDHRPSYRYHILKHKDESEVEMHKCPLCPYRTKCKNNLVNHRLVHLNPKDVPMYKCAKCELETRYKPYLILHLKMHQDPEIMKKFKCDKCPFRAVKRAQIRNHMIVHSNTRPFSCDQCTYSGKCKSSLLLHKLIHQTDAERKMYECKLCNYQSKCNNTLKSHMAKSHRDPTVPVMKCANCSYETTIKHSLSKHMIRRHSSRNYIKF